MRSTMSNTSRAVLHEHGVAEPARSGGDLDLRRPASIAQPVLQVTEKLLQRRPRAHSGGPESSRHVTVSLSFFIARAISTTPSFMVMREPRISTVSPFDRVIFFLSERPRAPSRPRSTPLRPSSYYAGWRGTTRTEHSARRITSSATLPSASRDSPERPLVPTTMSAVGTDRAASSTPVAGGLRRTRPSETTGVFARTSPSLSRAFDSSCSITDWGTGATEIIPGSAPARASAILRQCTARKRTPRRFASSAPVQIAGKDGSEKSVAASTPPVGGAGLAMRTGTTEERATRIAV